MNLNELFEAGIPAHIKPSDIPPAMRNRKLTMKDIEAERPKGAYRFRVGDKNFMDLGAAQDFAAGTGQKVERITEYKVKKKAEEPQDNFTIDDIKQLETITDLETLKAQAKQLIKGKPARRMKPEKIAYFYDKVDDMPGRLQIIKLMYDLLLSGEGHQVIGTKWGMNPNAYRSRFGEEKKDRSPGKISKSEDPCWSGYHMVGKKKKNGREVPNCVPGEKGAATESASQGHGVRVRRSGSDETVTQS